MLIRQVIGHLIFRRINLYCRYNATDLNRTLGRIISHSYVLLGSWSVQLNKATITAALTWSVSEELDNDANEAERKVLSIQVLKIMHGIVCHVFIDRIERSRTHYILSTGSRPSFKWEQHTWALRRIFPMYKYYKFPHFLDRRHHVWPVRNVKLYAPMPSCGEVGITVIIR